MICVNVNDLPLDFSTSQMVLPTGLTSDPRHTLSLRAGWAREVKEQSASDKVRQRKRVQSRASSTVSASQALPEPAHKEDKQEETAHMALNKARQLQRQQGPTAEIPWVFQNNCPPWR